LHPSGIAGDPEIVEPEWELERARQIGVKDRSAIQDADQYRLFCDIPRRELQGKAVDPLADPIRPDHQCEPKSTERDLVLRMRGIEHLPYS
jgi:hypothetical protein